MGLLWLLLIGLAAAALLWRLGVARPLWSMAGAALMLGATGYSLQGRPLLAGSPTRADAKPIPVEPELVALRDEMFGRYSSDGAYLVASDAMLRAGDAGAAVQVLLGGIRGTPRSALLWTGLGGALAAHDGGQVSPAALLAFGRATEIAPQHPGPPFFTGMAYVRAGKLAEARAYWRRALSLVPASSPLHRPIAVRLKLVEMLLDRMTQQNH